MIVRDYGSYFRKNYFEFKIFGKKTGKTISNTFVFAFTRILIKQIYILSYKKFELTFYVISHTNYNNLFLYYNNIRKLDVLHWFVHFKLLYNLFFKCLISLICSKLVSINLDNFIIINGLMKIFNNIKYFCIMICIYTKYNSYFKFNSLLF